MSELHFRKRHRLRQKEIGAIADHLDSVLGTKTFIDLDTVDLANGPEYDVIFVKNSIRAFTPGGEPFLTIRGLLVYGATKRYVTVDMGAVKFVYNGADVMGPGVVDFDPAIKEGDLVWIRDVKNRQPLAVGRAVVGADVLLRKEKGKVVASIHHVGDKLWMVEEEEKE